MEPAEPLPKTPPEITPEQRAAMEAWLAAQPLYGEQDENGIDVSLLRKSLRLTPTERYHNHQRSLKLAKEVYRVGIQLGLTRLR